MSDNQEQKRKRGRPRSDESFALPDGMRQILEECRFFDLHAPHSVRWGNLPEMSSIERVYRVRAAILFALTRFDMVGLEEKLQRSSKQICRYLAGAEMTGPVLEALAEAADIPAQWILTGSVMAARYLLEIVPDRNFAEEERSKTPLKTAEARYKDFAFSDINGENEDEPSFENQTIPFSNDHVVISRFPVPASAGFGMRIFDEPPACFWQAPRAMLRGFSGSLTMLASTDVSGDCMEPTLHDGEPVIFDRSAKQIDRDWVYVLSIGDNLYVKRVRRIPGDDGRTSLSLISDNPAYPEIILGPDAQEHVRVHGRVVWPETTKHRPF